MWSFQVGGTKLESFLHKNQYTQRKLLSFKLWINVELSKNVNTKKCAPKLVFFNEKKMRKIQMIFEIGNWLWKSNFGTFWQLAIIQISKFNNFLWVYWFLGKNISNFVSPVWTLHNPYCHNVQLYFWHAFFRLNDEEKLK